MLPDKYVAKGGVEKIGEFYDLGKMELSGKFKGGNILRLSSFIIQPRLKFRDSRLYSLNLSHIGQRSKETPSSRSSHFQ